MGTRVDQAARVSHARRPLGKPCRACGSTNTWVEMRREVDRTRPGAAGEWPYAVCQACGHVVKGRRTEPHQQVPSAPTNRVEQPAPSDASPTASRDADDGDSWRARAPRPTASDERVEELLRAAGYNRAITPVVLEQHRRFASHAGKPGLSRWKAAVSVLNGAQGRDEVPSVSEIYAEDKQRREVKQARAAQLRRQSAELADQHIGAAREHVARIWAQTGEGPTWREMADALGVDGRLASAMVDAMRRRGALTSTSERRSLAVTTDWVPPTA